jgi:hypothetical protein
MSASPKSKREQPPRRFDDYILTKEVSSTAGLYPIDNSAMTYVLGDAGLTQSDDGGAFLDIGFSFTMDDIVFQRIYVNVNGYAILVNSSIGETNLPNSMLKSVYNNSYLRSSSDPYPLPFPYSSLPPYERHILLAPWWDDLRNTSRDIAKDIQDPTTNYNLSDYLSTYYPGVPVSDFTSGKVPTPPAVDPSSGGVKYFIGSDLRRGRVFVARWKSWGWYYYRDGGHTSGYNIVYYDIVIYETGEIEFRYNPRLVNGFDNYESATIGIFQSSENYRDFGPLLKKDTTNPRANHPNGGVSWNGTFTDTVTLGESGTAKYTISLNTFNHWPGQGQFGAIFRFSPPKARRKTGKSIVSIRDGASFANSSGTSFFDDQHTIPFVAQSVEYPSMLPSSFKTTSNSSQTETITELYQSGSITVNRVFTSGLFDSVLEDSILEGRKRRGV